MEDFHSTYELEANLVIVREVARLGSWEGIFSLTSSSRTDIREEKGERGSGRKRTSPIASFDIRKERFSFFGMLFLFFGLGSRRYVRLTSKRGNSNDDEKDCYPETESRIQILSPVSSPT